MFLSLVVLVIGGSNWLTIVGGFSFETPRIGAGAETPSQVLVKRLQEEPVSELGSRSHYGEIDGTTSSSSSSKQQQDPVSFWRTPTDPFEVLWKNTTTTMNTNSTNSPGRIRAIRLIVRGKPLPLKRHRTSSNKRNVYNPSAKPQAEFRQVVQEILSLYDNNFRNNQPLFGSQEQLVMKLVFHMNRPKSHFLRSTNNYNNNRLRKGISPWGMVTKKVDVDNLAKFVLDSLNGILYDDDQQIFSLSATKVYDNSDSNGGATYLHLYSIPFEVEEEMAQFMEELLS